MFVKARLRRISGEVWAGYAAYGSRFIRGEPGTLDFHTTEATHVNATVGRRLRATPLLQLRHLQWDNGGQVIHDIPAHGQSPPATVS